MSKDKSEKKAVGESFCELMLALRERHILIWLTLIFSAISGFTLFPWKIVLLDEHLEPRSWVLPVRVICLIAIAFLAAADKIADVQAKKNSVTSQKDRETKDRKAYNQSISSLLELANHGAGIAFETTSNRKVALEKLRTVLATATHGLSTVAQTRATYYTLEFTNSGRILKDPISFGRVENATTIWDEAEAPDHSVWNIMDGDDVNAPIVRSTDPSKANWVDWEAKKYRSFISVPVKAHGAQFGMLSLNAPKSEDLTQTDRMGVLVAARLMATTLALGLPQAEVKERAQKLAEVRNNRNGNKPSETSVVDEAEDPSQQQ